jgi:hypothetical protein
MQVRTRDRGKQLGARYGESHNGAVRGKYPSMDSRLGGDIRGALIPITGTCTADKKKKKEEMMENLILNVEARSAAELIKHSHGPGTRFVFSDHNNNPEGSIYVIMRSVENVDNPEMHIEPHTHDFESLFIFKGYNPDMSGLVVEVLLGDAWHRIESPKTIRIPPGLNHNYRFIKGSGEYWNIVLTPGANYNKTVK